MMTSEMYLIGFANHSGLPLCIERPLQHLGQLSPSCVDVTHEIPRKGGGGAARPNV